MSKSARAALAASLLALAACGGGGNEAAANASGNRASEANAAAPTGGNAAAADKPQNEAAPAATAGGGAALSRDYLIGKWSETDDCADSIEFRADGSFTFPWGDSGQWQLSGDRLTMSTNTGDLRVAAIDATHIQVSYPGGRVARSTRC